MIQCKTLGSSTGMANLEGVINTWLNTVDSNTSVVKIISVSQSEGTIGAGALKVTVFYELQEVPHSPRP